MKRSRDTGRCGIIIYNENTDERCGIDIRSTTDAQQRRSTVARSRCSSMQQRQYRLRSYGVSSAHGDGQMLLPINNNNSNQTNNNNQSSNDVLMTTAANLTHRHISSSQQNNAASESQPRRVPTSVSISTSTPISNSTSTSTATATATATNTHQRSHLPGLQNQ